MNNASNPPQSSFSNWLLAIRPFAFSASTVPIIYGAALAVYTQQEVWWSLFPLVLIASLSIHTATNLVSEYFDFIKGVDHTDTYGDRNVLVEGLMQPRQVFLGGLFCFGVTAAIGLTFVVLRGWPILILGTVGMAGGFFYTAAPIGYKYRGAGDFLVFWLMGPLMVIGSYFVLTGTYSHNILLTSLPIGCLVAGILSANNLRDIRHDTQAGITTTAGLLGHRWARWEYSSLIAGAYGIVMLSILLGRLPAWSLLILLTAPIGLKNIRSALHSAEDKPEDIAALDQQTAQLHLAFGILLTISVLLGRIF